MLSERPVGSAVSCGRGRAEQLAGGLAGHPPPGPADHVLEVAVEPGVAPLAPVPAWDQLAPDPRSAVGEALLPVGGPCLPPGGWHHCLPRLVARDFSVQAQNDAGSSADRLDRYAGTTAMSCPIKSNSLARRRGISGLTPQPVAGGRRTGFPRTPGASSGWAPDRSKGRFASPSVGFRTRLTTNSRCRIPYGVMEASTNCTDEWAAGRGEDDGEPA